MLSGDSEGPLVLLIIKPTKNISATPHFGQSEDERIKHTSFFLIDVNATKLHNCGINKKSIESLANFLQMNKS